MVDLKRILFAQRIKNFIFVAFSVVPIALTHYDISWNFNVILNWLTHFCFSKREFTCQVLVDNGRSANEQISAATANGNTETEIYGTGLFFSLKPKIFLNRQFRCTRWQEGVGIFVSLTTGHPANWTAKRKLVCRFLSKNCKIIPIRFTLELCKSHDRRFKFYGWTFAKDGRRWSCSSALNHCFLCDLCFLSSLVNFRLYELVIL